MSAIKQSVTGTGNIVLGNYTLTATATGTVYSTGNPQTSVSGNAGTATALQTTRTIGGSNFNGTGNVTSFPSPGAIGGTTPAAGTFTTINGLTIPATTGTLTIGLLVPVEFQQQFQTIGTFYAGGNVYISDALTTAGDVIFSGAYNATFTLTANTAVTFPTFGTLLSSTAIGVSVQAYDSDLTTWAGITPAANVGTFLATPSGSNLASALTSALPVSKGGTGLTAGTSGGILSFTASGTIASSGALAANAIVIGGGAGVAPSTTTTGAGVLAALAIAPNAAGGFALTSVSSTYLRNGASQTLTGGTPVALAFPTAVKTDASFNGTTFTAPATGFADVTGVFSLYCQSIIGDAEKGNLTVFVRDTTASTDVQFICESLIVPFATIASALEIHAMFPLLASVAVVSGHTYQIQCIWDNGGDDAAFDNGFLKWKM